jgi:hypothetical protein
VDDLTRDKGYGEADSATTLDGNPDTADASRARVWLERNEIVVTRNEVDRANRVDYPEVQEVTARGEGGRERNGANGKTQLCVVIHIGALLKCGDIEGCGRRGVRMGEIAQEGSMRGGTPDVAIFLDDELALGKCPLQKGIVGRRT